MTIVYKICLDVNGKYFSFNSCPFIKKRGRGCRLEYRIGKARRPSKRIPNSKLFAFSTLATAVRFRDSFSPRHPIFEAKATNVIPGIYICNNFTDAVCKLFWEEVDSDGCIINMDGDEYVVDIKEAPLGTVYCDTITLLRRVDQEL
jgi:hypothetical protein